jgi:hypothetical protein
VFRATSRLAWLEYNRIYDSESQLIHESTFKLYIPSAFDNFPKGIWLSDGCSLTMSCSCSGPMCGTDDEDDMLHDA